MGDTFEDTSFRTKERSTAGAEAGSNRQLSSGMARPSLNNPRVNAPTPQIDMDTEFGDETPKSFFETGLAASQEENATNALRMSRHQARVRADQAQMDKGLAEAAGKVGDAVGAIPSILGKRRDDFMDTFAREQGRGFKTPLRSLALAATRPRASTPLEKREIAKKKKTTAELDRAMNLSR